MRSCRPTRGPTLKPVLILATTANSIERAGRRLRPEKKPVRAGASPAGTSSGRCGRGRGSSSPARKRVTKVDRQGVAAGDCSRVTASASRLAEQRPSVGEVAVPPRPKGRSALARIEQALAPPSATKQVRALIDRRLLLRRGNVRSGCLRHFSDVMSRSTIRLRAATPLVEMVGRMALNHVALTVGDRERSAAFLRRPLRADAADP